MPGKTVKKVVNKKIREGKIDKADLLSLVILIMSRVRKKILYAVLILAVVGIVLAIIWQRLMTVHEPILNNTNYKFELDTIKSVRKELAKQETDLKKVKKLFVKNISEKIFPYWYGTKWDFNGTTQMPQQGSIACGYFVTTTLQHMGVKINRVKMAQCASEEMIRSLTSKKNIYHLSGLTLIEFEAKLKKTGNGLYIIGLDNHTGYVLISESGNFFIHASGWFPFKVVKDKLSEANVIGRSKYRVVGKISDDETFLKNWISKED